MLGSVKQGREQKKIFTKEDQVYVTRRWQEVRTKGENWRRKHSRIVSKDPSPHHFLVHIKKLLFVGIRWQTRELLCLCSQLLNLRIIFVLFKCKFIYNLTLEFTFYSLILPAALVGCLFSYCSSCNARQSLYLPLILILKASSSFTIVYKSSLV